MSQFKARREQKPIGPQWLHDYRRRRRRGKTRQGLFTEVPRPERGLGDAGGDEGRRQGLWSREATQGVLARSAR